MIEFARRASGLPSWVRRILAILLADPLKIAGPANSHPFRKQIGPPANPIESKYATPEFHFFLDGMVDPIPINQEIDNLSFFDMLL